MQVRKREMEEWVSAYLYDSGYFSGTGHPQLFKSLFMKSFPKLNSGNEVTSERIEDYLVNYIRMLNNYLDRETTVSKRWQILSNSTKLKTA